MHPSPHKLPLAPGEVLRAGDASRRLAARTLRVGCFAALCLVSLLTSSATAQVLQAKWVEESQERIEEIRKTDLRIIVIDQAGNPVAKCPVHIEQLRHDFLFGVRLPRSLPQGLPKKEEMSKAPLWRLVNAVALDAVTGWPLTQPAADRWDFQDVEKLLGWAEERQLLTRWGSVVSSDPGRFPDWAARLEGDELRQVLEAHARQVLSRFGKRVEQFDMVTQTLDHQHIEKSLGSAAVRRLYSLADSHRSPLASAPRFGHATLAFDDAFSPDRLRKALQQVTAMREGFVPVDSVAIEVRLSGSLVEAPITRHLTWMGDPGLPVIVTNLEVAGATYAGASVNLETALRAMFSHACVKGIFFAGLRGSELHDENAALMEEDGTLTESGVLLDRMVRQLWWSDLTTLADDLGNVRQRVFAGTYRLTATLPDGSIADAQVHLRPGDTKLILLQPVKAKPSAESIAKAADKKADAPVETAHVEAEDDNPLIKLIVDDSFEPTSKQPPGKVPELKRPPADINGRQQLELIPDR